MALDGEVYDAILASHRDRWTHGDEMLALILESVDRLSILFMQAWGDKAAARAASKQRPYRYKRPIERRPKRHRRATNEEISRFFGIPLRRTGAEGVNMTTTTEGGD